MTLGCFSTRRPAKITAAQQVHVQMRDRLSGALLAIDTEAIPVRNAKLCRQLARHEMRRMEFATGKVMWSEPGLTRTALLMVDGHFICLAEDGTFLLLKVNPHKFELVSRLEGSAISLEYPCWPTPILAHGLLYVRGKDRLVCLELIHKK